MASTVTFKPNAMFAKEFHSPGGMTGKWLKNQGQRVEKVSKTLVGKRTGRLQSSIKTGKVTKAGATDLEVEVGSNVSYALVHHEGSRPHVINARPGGVLHWGGARGPTVISVNHPGTRPNKYLLRALNIVVGGMR